MIEQFTLLRPLWLFALLPLAGLIWQLFKGNPNSRSWQSVVDPELLPHLLGGKFQARQSRTVVLVAVIGFVAIIALAGPVWEKLPQPVYRQQAALVIALDLSRSMDATDVKPSRLTRARHKIADILSRRGEGQAALVVYAADAFLVTPLTEDVGTIKALLPSLSTDLMPTQGSRVDRALQQALRLFDNGGVQRGDILIVSDGLSANEVVEAERILRNLSGYRISILGVGSETGGPIPLASGGFLKDASGSIIVPRMPVDSMARLTAKGSGEFQTITTDDQDILSILDHMRRNRFETEAIASDQTADIWREQGPWVLLFILPFIALVFRRGVLFMLPLLLIPFSPGADAFGWEELWQNQNQRGSLQFEQGAHEQAAELFKNPGWKASSYYRAGDYDEALQYWAEQADESAYYNQGNALAKLDRLDEAVKAYEKALEINPQHQDASYNKKLLEDLIEQQQQQQKDQQDQQQDQQGSEQQQSQDSSQEQQADGERDQRRSDENNNQQNSQAQQDRDPQTAETGQQESTQPQASQVDQRENQQLSEDEQLAEMEQQMSEQAADQWLRKIPDDPGGLLRRKFIYQYQNRAGSSVETNQW
ncbi:MAG: VWA domain-containing protein [Gammaproteobacteria bacterium]